jgi:TM2 domain-containing membrane protein YozV
MGTTIPVADQQRTMLYLANKKSTGVAYLLWFFLGMLGAHRFYAGRTGSAVVLLLLTLLGFLLSFVVIGLFVLIIPGLWVLIDAFLIPGMISSHNAMLAMRIGR